MTSFDRSGEPEPVWGGKHHAAATGALTIIRATGSTAQLASSAITAGLQRESFFQTSLPSRSVSCTVSKLARVATNLSTQKAGKNMPYGYAGFGWIDKRAGKLVAELNNYVWILKNPPGKKSKREWSLARRYAANHDELVKAWTIESPIGWESIAPARDKDR
jgi:hypothetical protein